MAEYKVVFEIQVSAGSPIEAAEIVQNWLQEPGGRFTYVVQEDDEQQDDDNPIYFVDLEEEEDDVIFQVENYKPLIQ